MDTSEGLNRLSGEYRRISRQPIPDLGCSVGLYQENDLYRWKSTFMGPKDSPYTGGMFIFELIFPKDYTNNPPQINFLTPIYHPNVCPYKNSLGSVCPNFIKYWDPSTTPRNLLVKLYSIFYKVNPESAFDKEIANEYLNNRPLYESKVKFFTKKYANAYNLVKDKSDNDWNFSCGESALNPYVKAEENNSEIYNKYDGNEQSIMIQLSFNGNPGLNVQCQLKEKIRDVVNRFLIKGSYKCYNEPFVFSGIGIRVNLDKQVGYVFKNFYQANVLNISDVEFLK